MPGVIVCVYRINGNGLYVAYLIYVASLTATNLTVLNNIFVVFFNQFEII